MHWTTPAVVCVLLIATVIRSAFGFGEALVAVPLLAMLLPVSVAAPIAVLVSITVAAVVLVQDWSDVHARSAGWLVFSTFAGIPLGLVLVTRVAEPIVKSVLAGVIIAFAAYSLSGGRRRSLSNDRFAWLFGFSAGVLGGAYGMNGPPLVIYGTLRGWSPRHFRATLQGYFLPASVVIMAGYWMEGMWTRTVTHDYIVSLPAVLAAIPVGRAINRRLDRGRFLRYVYIGLAAIGVMLLAQAIGG